MSGRLSCGTKHCTRQPTRVFAAGRPSGATTQVMCVLYGPCGCYTVGTVQGSGCCNQMCVSKQTHDVRHTQTHRCVSKHSYVCGQTQSYVCEQSNARCQTHSHTYNHMVVSKQTHDVTHTHTQTNTHARTHARTQHATHKHAHTHTHTRTWHTFAHID